MLAGGAAALFGELFTPLYLAARVWTTATSYAPDGTLTRVQTEADCRAQIDAATEQMRAAEGYSTTDRALYLLRASFDGPLDSDCELEVDAGPYAGTRWRIAAPIESDPAAAYWLARGVLQK